MHACTQTTELEKRVFAEVGTGGFSSEEFDILQQLGRISVHQVCGGGEGGAHLLGQISVRNVLVDVHVMTHKAQVCVCACHDPQGAGVCACHNPQGAGVCACHDPQGAGVCVYVHVMTHKNPSPKPKS